MTFGLTPQGFLTPRAADLLEQIRDRYELDTGLTIDWDADVFLGVITAIMSERTGALAEMLQAIADSRDPNNATGAQLDAIASLVGVSRLPAAFSEVDLTLGGTPGTAIPSGSEVEYSDGQTWITSSAATIGPGGSVVVAASPPVTGQIVAPASPSGSDWEIVTPVTGWDTVSTAADATPGRDRESDADLRVRRQQSLQITGAGSLPAIRSNVLQVDGVQAAVAIENTADTAQSVAGVTLAAHSLGVVVYPTLTTDQREELAAQIYALTPAGIETNGPESEVVVGADGFDKEIRWFYATEIPVLVEVEILGIPAIEAEDEIARKVEDHLAALGAGDPLRVLAIQGIAASVQGVTHAYIYLNGSTADVIPEITEIITLIRVDVNDA